MKRFLAICLALLCMAAPALATDAEIAARTGMASEDGEYYESMTVVNCSEWVSLRSGPSTSSAQLAKVPLGATVTECWLDGSDFAYCCYNGQWGYILAGYLSTGAEEYVGDMTVVNCEEWVSMRKSPSTSAERVTTVPLGAVVTNSTRRPDGFVYCEYNGFTGYVLGSYLAAGKVRTSAYGTPMWEYAFEGCTVYAYHSYSGGETLFVECVDAQEQQVWSRAVNIPEAMQLDATDAFVGGTAELPVVMLYDERVGLYALDFLTGEEKWLLPRATAYLGGCICHAVAEDGTMYIGGYDGPDPVAVSANGEVLWQASTNHDAYWLHEITVDADGVTAVYDCIDVHEAAGKIVYDLTDGSEKTVEWF